MTTENTELMQALNQLREINEKGIKMNSEDLEKISKLNTRLDASEEKNNQLVKQLTEEKSAKEDLVKRIDDLEKGLGRLPGGKSAGIDGQDVVVECKNFINTMLRDSNTAEFIKANQSNPIVGMSKKSYNETIDPNGGYLVPPQYYQEVIKKITEISPIRQYAKVVTISSNRLEVRLRNALIQGGWVNETKPAPVSQSPYGNIEILAHKLMVNTSVSAELINDSTFNVEQLIAEDMIENFAQLEGRAFVLGNGLSQPYGLITNANIQKLTSSVVGSYTPDDLIKLTGELKDGYAPMWMLNRRELARVRLFKDGIGRYLWTPGLAEGKPNMINGEPYVSVIDMPNAAAGATPILYGDVRRAYMIVDNMRMSMIRDPFTQSSSDMISITAHRRVGGAVVLPEAIKLIVCAS